MDISIRSSKAVLGDGQCMSVSKTRAMGAQYEKPRCGHKTKPGEILCSQHKFSIPLSEVQREADRIAGGELLKSFRELGGERVDINSWLIDAQEKSDKYRRELLSGWAEKLMARGWRKDELQLLFSDD